MVRGSLCARFGLISRRSKELKGWFVCNNRHMLGSFDIVEYLGVDLAIEIPASYFSIGDVVSFQAEAIWRIKSIL
jgi:hypothetical protein